MSEQQKDAAGQECWRSMSAAEIVEEDEAAKRAHWRSRSAAELAQEQEAALQDHWQGMSTAEAGEAVAAALSDRWGQFVDAELAEEQESYLGGMSAAELAEEDVIAEMEQRARWRSMSEAELAEEEEILAYQLQVEQDQLAEMWEDRWQRFLAAELAQEEEAARRQHWRSMSAIEQAEEEEVARQEHWDGMIAADLAEKSGPRATAIASGACPCSPIEGAVAADKHKPGADDLEAARGDEVFLSVVACASILPASLRVMRRLIDAHKTSVQFPIIDPKSSSPNPWRAAADLATFFDLLDQGAPSPEVPEGEGDPQRAGEMLALFDRAADLLIRELLAKLLRSHG